jgi:hypothetical protein
MNNTSQKNRQINIIDRAWHKLDSLPWNPQLLRELKGRFKPINLIVAAIISIFGQVLIYLYFQSRLDNILRFDPLEIDKNIKPFTDRYCIGTPPSTLLNNQSGINYSTNNHCVADSSNNWVINWELWHLDIFVWLAIIATFGLLVIGSYLLVADLAKEEKTGNFNFIRIGDRSVNSIFLGKIFGVPCLLYLVFLLATPFSLYSGINAGIPIDFILGFYTLLLAACFCCYSLAILFGLANFGATNLKAFAVSGSILVILILLTSTLSYIPSINKNGLDWFIFIDPDFFLAYLVNASEIPHKFVGYLSLDNLKQLSIYGINIGSRTETFFAVSLANYAICIYWIWQGIKRKFHDNIANFIGKKQSYFLTLSVCFIFQGLTLQNPDLDKMTDHYIVLHCILALFGLMSIFVLASQRQNLYDWIRYRHLKNRKNRSLWKDLFWQEKSPATVVVAINLLIIFIYTTPAIFMFVREEDKWDLFWGSIVNLNMTLVYASIVQLMFLLNNKRKGLLAFATITSLAVFPIVILGIFNISPISTLLPWLFTVVPSVAIDYAGVVDTFGTIVLGIIGQWLVIGLCNLQIYRQLNKASLVGNN